MAQLAVNFFMLTDQWQFGRIMIKRVDLLIEHPSFSTVAGTACHLESRSMRLFRLLPGEEKHKKEY